LLNSLPSGTFPPTLLITHKLSNVTQKINVLVLFDREIGLWISSFHDLKGLLKAQKCPFGSRMRSQCIRRNS